MSPLRSHLHDGPRMPIGVRRLVAYIACVPLILSSLACSPDASLTSAVQQADSTEARQQTDRGGAGSRNAERPWQADAFVESIGVNTHFGYTDTKYYTHYEELREKLVNLGVRYVRDVPELPGGWKDPHLLDLHEKTGIRSLLLVMPRKGGHPHPLDLDSTVTKQILEGIERHFVDGMPAAVAIEGPNEYDISHSSDPHWQETLRRYQSMLYGLVKSDPGLSALPVLAPSFAHPSGARSFGSVDGMADALNLHAYPGGGVPARGLERALVDGSGCGACPIWVTETGYHNALGNAMDGEGYLSQPGVPEDVEARYLPRLFMEYFRRGIARTFSYELLDLFENAGNDHQERNFGLLRNDLSEKPVYRALSNTIHLLEDPGPPFEPAPLAYTLGGRTENLRQVLLQKRDGRYYLVLWQEVPSYEIREGWKRGDRGSSLQVQPAEVTITFDRSFERAVEYVPSGERFEHRRWEASSTIQVLVPDHLLVLELTFP